MPRFVAKEIMVGQYTAVKLSDETTGANAVIVPQLGNNCLQLHLVKNGRLIPVIDDLQFISLLPEKPARYGIPVLFPWASGIPEGKYSFEEKSFQALSPTGDGSFHHGFANRLPWEIEAIQSYGDKAELISCLSASSAGKLLQGFPWDFELRMIYRLNTDGLSIFVQIKNLADTIMPLSFGLHPFFVLPEKTQNGHSGIKLNLGSVGQMYDIAACLSADPEKSIFAPTSAEIIIQDNGQCEMSDTAFNHVFQNEDRKSDFFVSGFKNLAADYEVNLAFSTNFNVLVVFTPLDRNAVSIEPWTGTVNTFNLYDKKIPGNELKKVLPGEIWSGNVAITVA